MIDLACHAVSLRAVPVAALLVRAGVPRSLAWLLEEVLLAHAEPDRGLDAIVEGLLAPGAIAPIVPPSAFDDVAAMIAASTPRSVLGGATFLEVLLACAPGRLEEALGDDSPDSDWEERVGARRALLHSLLAEWRTPEGASLAALLDRLAILLPSERGAMGAALATMPDAELFVAHGGDFEHALAAPPRMDLKGQLARLRAIAACSEGRVAAFVPCDPHRPECVAVVRESLARGFVGASVVHTALPAAGRNEGASGWSESPRRVTARLIEALRCCASAGAPVTLFLGATSPPSPAASELEDAASIVAAWGDLLSHARLASLRVALVPPGPGFTLVRDARDRAMVEVDDAMEAALELAASRPATWCVLSPALAAAGPASAAADLEEATLLWRQGIVGAARRRPALATRIALGSSLPQVDAALVAAGRENLPALLRPNKGDRAFLASFEHLSALEFLDLDHAVRRCGEMLSEQERERFEALAAGELPLRAAGVAALAAAVATETNERRRRAARAGKRPTRRSATKARASSRSDATLEATALDAVSFDADVLVIGAGIAGLTAARDIAEGRDADGRPWQVIVLEAADRVGGRLHTWRDSPFGPLELGGELVHRPPGDQWWGNFTLWNELRRYGLSTRKIDKLSASAVHSLRWRSAGPALRRGCAVCNDPDIAKGLDVLDRVARSSASGGRPDQLAGDLLSSLVAAHGENARAMGDLLLTGTVPGRLHELSVAGLAADRVKDQEMSMEEYHVVAGYDALPASIGRGVDVRLRASARRIEWGPDGVSVSTEDGRVFRARAVLCTVSVGVLNSGGLEFDPPLPAQKQAALSRLELGPISKAILIFDRPFWGESIAILGNLDPKRTSARTYFVPLYNADSDAPVITALFNGDLARELDAAVGGRADVDSDDAIPAALRSRVDAFLARAVADLGAIFPVSGAGNGSGSGSGGARLLRWRVRSWANDPFVRGGTSFIRHAPGQSRGEAGRVRRELAQPTPPLFWAGEATAIWTNPWSVHGAHQSGADAARLVRDFLRPMPE